MRRVWKPWLVSAAVLAVGMVLTAVLAALSLDRHRDRAELEFLAKVDQVHHVLHRTVEGYVDSLHAFVAFFVASETVTSGEFVRFAEPMLARHAGVRLIAWAPAYPPDRRLTALSLLQAYGVHGRTDPRTGETLPPSRDHGSVPLLYLAPVEAEDLRGSDFSAPPEYRAALQWARDSGGPAVTAPLELHVPRSRPAIGVAMVMPVYAGVAPANSIVERRARLKGFVLIALDVEAMLTQQVMDFVGGDLEVAVVDAGVPEGRGLLFGPAELAEADTANEPGALLESRGLAVPARGWQISYRPSVDLLDRLETQEPALIAAAGVLLSAIGAAWLGMMTHGRLAVRRLVDVRTLELRRAAEALRQNEQRFRSLFANMRDLVFCRGAKGQDRFGYDREGSIIYGRDAPKLTGAVDGDNFALDVWYESIHPDDRPAYEAAERRRKEEGRDFSLDYRLIHPVTGELRWMRETAWVVEDPETGQTFFDSYILDITDERRIADQLREAKTEAERASRAKSEFLANMSHEIRTPLNAILGFSEAMRMEIFGPMGNARYADYAGHICDSAEHLLSLINDLLDLSKVEAGKLELEETAIDPAAVVEEACRLVSAAAADNGVALLRRLPDQSPALWGDRRLVRQVLLNLLTNAVKFTPAAGRVTVSVSTEEDGALAVRVEDTGTGIPAAEIEKVLQPFGQAAYHRSHEERGTGLGLPLARSLVEAHGGRLTLHSTVGTGTTVTCLFPSHRVAPASVESGRAVG